MDNPINYWYQKYLAEKMKNEYMVEALRTEYEKGRADAFAQMQKEWSEEDENICCTIINDITNDKSMCKYEISKGICDVQINWLNSLKKRYTWTPSDEQITVLELASKYERVFTPKQIDILIGLKEQLKKLREE